MVLKNSVRVYNEEKEWTASQPDLATRTLPVSSRLGCPFVHHLKNTYLQGHSPLSCRTTSSTTSIASTALPRSGRRQRPALLYQFFFCATARSDNCVFNVSPLPKPRYRPAMCPPLTVWVFILFH